MADNVSTDKLIEDLHAVVRDAEDLLKATASQAGEKVQQARARAEESVTPEEFARAIADAALDPAIASGATIVVGGALASVPRG